MKGARNTEADFITGRDMAIALIAEGKAHQDAQSDDVHAMRGYRRGLPLNSFAEKYLLQLVETPALIQGFAAVLSCEMAEQGNLINGELAYRISMAEYLPGVVGADGTEYMDVDGEPLVSPESATVTTTVPKRNAAKVMLSDMQAKAYEVKSLAQGVFALVVDGKENDERAMAANVLLGMIEQHSEHIAESADIMDLPGTPEEVAYG